MPSTGGEQKPGTEENENEFYRCTLIDGLTGKATVCETEKDGLLEEPEHEEKKHYNFAGWYTDEGAAEFPIKVTQDISLVAVYEKIVYRISYELGGGINAPENPTKYDIETPSVELLPAERKCFEFGGWYDENGNVRTSVDIDSDGERYFTRRMDKRRACLRFGSCLRRMRQKSRTRTYIRKRRMRSLRQGTDVLRM